MKPGFIDFVAAILAVCIAVPSLIVIDALFFQFRDAFSVQTSRQQKYPYNPYAQNQPYQPRPQPRPTVPKPPPSPPPTAPYTMTDCAMDVRLGSDNPHQVYIDRFCECFTPRRANLGPKNLTEEQEVGVWPKIEGEITPECERQGLAPFINAQNLEENFSKKFRKQCIDNPVIFFGEQSKFNKNDQLCQCLTSGLLRDRTTMAASVVGAGRVAGRPSVLNQINICVRESFPPTTSIGWQILKRPDGRASASVSSKNHEYISSMEFSCSDSGKIAFAVTWRKKPVKEQFFFYGGEDDEDIIIPLKGGYAEGKNAKKLYDLIVAWQKSMRDGNQDLDLTGFTFQTTGNELGEKQEIILGDTQKRVGEIVQACKSTKRQPDLVTTATPKNSDSDKKPPASTVDRKSRCNKQALKAGAEFDQASDALAKANTLFNGVELCRLSKIRFQKAEAFLKIARECNDVTNSDAIQSDVRRDIQSKYARYKSECLD